MNFLRISGNCSLLIAKLIFYYTLFIGFFTYNFNAPVTLLYVGDLFNLILLTLCSKRIANAIKKTPLRTFTLLMLGVCVCGFFSALFNGGNIALIIWSLRNWGRAVTFFLACCCVLNERQSSKLIVFTKNLFHINLVVIMFQYIFLREEYNQDSLNGLFGRDTSSVNTIFLMVLLCIVLSEYFTKKMKIRELVLYLIGFNIVCALAELRGLIVFEIIFILFYALINYTGSVRQLMHYTLLILLMLIVASIAAQYLATLYPEMVGFFSIEGIINAANNEHGYGYSGYIDRLNFYSVINDYLFKGNILNILFGIGMGNAEYSTVSTFCSSFYNSYGTTFGYLRFSAPMLFLETGLIGLVMFFGAFVALLLYCIKKIRAKRINGNDLLFKEIGAGILGTVILYLIYNNLQRTDVSFVIAFYAAIPFAQHQRITKVHPKN